MPSLGKEITIEERRKILISILKYIDYVCSKNELHYYIAYGSLLGTIRHKGFIPWDDDIDIWVPIDEYEKLLDIVEKDGKYVVGNNVKDKNWFINFAKISDKRTFLVDAKQSNFTYKGATQRGIAVDIFPLFETNDDKNRKLPWLVDNRRRCYWYEHEFLHGWKKAIIGASELFGWSTERFTKKILELEKTSTNNGLIGCPISPYGVRDSFKKEWFATTEYFTFEDIRVRVPKGYNEILIKLYGDYMTPPPESERQTLTHNVKACWVNDEKSIRTGEKLNESINT